MLHAESRVRLLECEDEITIEPCSKKMKSTEGAYEKLSDGNNQGIWEEVDAERTSNDLIPAYASDNQGQHEMQKQEKIPTGVLDTLNEALPENNVVLSQPVDSETVQNINLPFASINDTKIEEKKGPFITNNAGEDIKNSCMSFSLNRNASNEEFFTSKEFIGPIYKPAKSNKQDKTGSCNECRSSEGDQNELHENKAKIKEAKQLQTISSAVPEIDDELDQFYKEIHQLENENLDANFQEKETGTSQEQYSPYNCSQTSQEDYQRLSLGSPQPFYENGQCFSGEQSNEQQFVVEKSVWKNENTFNGQVDSKYWNCSVPEFRPAWQSTESFLVPQGPLPHRFNHQLHFQILNSPPQNPNALLSQNSELSYKNHHGYHGNTDINSHGPLLDQSTSYAGHTDICTTQVFRNGNNDQNGLQNNGFCETREECWKDPKADSTEGMHNFSSLQLPEEGFGCSQKLLLILRGLPGSGKTTLSRETILKKNPGHLLTKEKQRKKRKRNKKMKGNHTEITKKKLGKAAHHPIPDHQDMSESEEDDSEEENSKSLCTFSGGPEDPVTVCEEQPNDPDESLKEVVVISTERFPVTVSEVSTGSDNAWKNDLPVESDNSLLINIKPFSTESLTKNALDDEETNQRHKENLSKSSFLKMNSDKNSIQETEGISEDCNTLLLSTENILESYQITCEPDMEAKLLSLSGEEKDISQCYNSNAHDNVPDNNTEDKGALKAGENTCNAWAFFSVDLPTEELQLDFDTQASLSSWSEDKFVGEQRPPKMRKPKQTHMNSSTQLNCRWSNEGLVKENHQVTVTAEVGNIISNGLSASPAGEVHFDSLVEPRATFMQCSSEVNIPRKDAVPITSKRKRHRRIVNLAPKFDLPRQIAGSTEGGKEVSIKDVPQESVLEVGQKSFLSKDSGEEREQNRALQGYSAPYSGTKATYSLPAPNADALLHDISYSHSGQSSLMPKYSCKVPVVSGMKEEEGRTLKQQQVVDKKEGESEQVTSEVTNRQPDILSSVQVVSEHPEDSSILASCGENVHEEDDPEPAEASQLEDNQDVNMKCSFLGLPLSLGFAFQLVQLFGSPGLPLESLLPDDYIVPLDWKVSKMIYLLWKTSVEEKQKTNGLQNGNALADDTLSLEDLHKNCQEDQDSSETLAEMELFQGVLEENILTYSSGGCLDTVFHHS